ncbi:hypothetical protein LCGC14_0174550 [marine sediment metagenome]|uniref:Uncharacterized protein n=1 Tax=marine sediment metagenome TaxID=412755 RepID=A0A0F9X9D4_9ZZZZ
MFIKEWFKIDTTQFLLTKLKKMKDNKDLIAFSQTAGSATEVTGYILEVDVLDHDLNHDFNLFDFDQERYMEIIYIKFEQHNKFYIVHKDEYSDVIENPISLIYIYLELLVQFGDILSKGFLNFWRHKKKILLRFEKLRNRIKKSHTIDFGKDAEVKRIITFLIRDPTTISFSILEKTDKSEKNNILEKKPYY